MKKIYSTLVALLATANMFAQGWPANHSGVMLQGFYWDSFSDSKWTHLEAQAPELGQYFNLVWIPQIHTDSLSLTQVLHSQKNIFFIKLLPHLSLSHLTH